jgi:hypothetical protein
MPFTATSETVLSTFFKTSFAPSTTFSLGMEVEKRRVAGRNAGLARRMNDMLMLMVVVCGRRLDE